MRLRFIAPNRNPFGGCLFTDPKNPGGCFGTQSVVTCSGVSAQFKRKLELMRGDFETKLKKRLDRAVEAGELPAGTSTIDLARYYAVVFQGLGMQAKGGGSQRELLRVVDVAMGRWPANA